jgi:hypothetical protein
LPDGIGKLKGSKVRWRRRSKLDRLQRREIENRELAGFTLYSDGQQPESESWKAVWPPVWNTQGTKLYGSVERATRRKAKPQAPTFEAAAARSKPKS